MRVSRGLSKSVVITPRSRIILITKFRQDSLCTFLYILHIVTH